MRVGFSSTFVKSTPSLFSNDFLQALTHAVHLTLVAVGDVHPTLDRDVGVCDACRQ